MSTRRTITDSSLQSWEAYSSCGDFGMPEQPMVVFNCVTSADLQARFVIFDGDEAEAAQALLEMSDAELAALFNRSEVLP